MALAYWDMNMMHFLVVGVGKACICCKTNKSFLGKVLTEILMMDTSLDKRDFTDRVFSLMEKNGKGIKCVKLFKGQV